MERSLRLKLEKRIEFSFFEKEHLDPSTKAVIPDHVHSPEEEVECTICAQTILNYLPVYFGLNEMNPACRKCRNEVPGEETIEEADKLTISEDSTNASIGQPWHSASVSAPLSTTSVSGSPVGSSKSTWTLATRTPTGFPPPSWPYSREGSPGFPPLR